MNNIIKNILKIPLLGEIILYIREFQNELSVYRYTKREFLKLPLNKKCIYYLGIPAHNNLEIWYKEFVYENG